MSFVEMGPPTEQSPLRGRQFGGYNPPDTSYTKLAGICCMSATAFRTAALALEIAELCKLYNTDEENPSQLLNYLAFGANTMGMLISCGSCVAHRRAYKKIANPPPPGCAIRATTYTSIGTTLASGCFEAVQSIWSWSSPSLHVSKVCTIGSVISNGISWLTGFPSDIRRYCTDPQY